MSRNLAARALAELRTIRSEDPAAADAIRAVRLTEVTLSEWCLPIDNERVARNTPPG